MSLLNLVRTAVQLRVAAEGAISPHLTRTVARTVAAVFTGAGGAVPPGQK